MSNQSCIEVYNNTQKTNRSNKERNQYRKKMGVVLEQFAIFHWWEECNWNFEIREEYQRVRVTTKIIWRWISVIGHHWFFKFHWNQNCHHICRKFWLLLCLPSNKNKNQLVFRFDFSDFLSGSLQDSPEFLSGIVRKSTKILQDHGRLSRIIQIIKSRIQKCKKKSKEGGDTGARANVLSDRSQMLYH